MNISGTTNTCSILTNTPFVLSGLSQTNLSTINITDDNGLDVSECFGITTTIVTVDGTNVTVTGDCNTSLEITITEGVNIPVTCEYTGYTEQQSGIILFEYTDGTTGENIHPDCCTSLGYDPEIGPDMYYICRSREEIDVTDCNNYTPTFDLDPNDWNIFQFVTGGTVTSVPSAECCYQYGFVELVTQEGIKCIVDEVFDPCNGLTVVEPAALFGPITFVDALGVETVIVPTLECCTSLGYDYTASEGAFSCFQSLALTKPSVSITNDACCEETTIPSPNDCNYDGTWYYYKLSPCNGDPIIYVRHTSELALDGVVYQPSGSGNVEKRGALADIDCDMLGVAIISGITTCDDF
jgi:hypothetical protein